MSASGPFASSCRHLGSSLLLALLLSLAQPAALLHHHAHAAATQAQHDGDTPHPVGEPCEFCLALAQVDSAAMVGASMPHLRSDLALPCLSGVSASGCAANLPPQRSRGPPASA